MMTHRLCDRPNLSKDYLAGNAPEGWIPLRPPEFYAEQEIELRLRTRVVAIDGNARGVQPPDGSPPPPGALLHAPGPRGRSRSGSAFPAATCRTFTICVRSRTAGR